MTTSFVRLTVSLFGSASLLGLSTTAHASHVLFSTDHAISDQTISSGEAIAVSKGTTQIALDNGGLASFVDAAQFAIRSDGSVDLRAGSVTVVSPKGAPVQVIMPQGVKGLVDGVNGSASFSVGGGGLHGSAIAGRTTIAAAGASRAFTGGKFWAAAPGQSPHQVVAAVAANVPQAVQKMRAGGIAAAASNGLPVALGEALAAVGAHGDILDAARRIDAFDRNPRLVALPQGDYAKLTAYAAQASAPFGGAAFNGAGADIVRSYFEYLAKGGIASDFRTGYARILLSYLDLLRAGALPSNFNAATQSQLSAYIAFIGRTDGFGALSATNRNVLDAYLTFLSGGGTPDGFNARATSLVASYLDYVRAGGDPAKFSAASQSVVSQYLQILQSGAIKGQLTAANQALLDAYLASVTKTGDGLAFSNSAAGSLASFTVFLNGGGFPSQYTAIDPATLRSYLETLDATGLFDRVLGGQAGFLRSYLTYLRSGARPDTFDKLPINILTAQAASLNAFAAFLNGGGLPSAYSALTADQITSYLAALQSANRFALTGDNAKLFADYYAFLASGGVRDAFAGLPINVLTGQANALSAYYLFIQGGGTPSLYGGLSQTQVLAYLKALQDSGLFGSLLGTNASFLADYYAFLSKGGNPDIYAGLPNVDLNVYAAQVSTFVAYLKSGKLPSAYGTLSVEQLRAYLNALTASGKLGSLLGSDAGFLADYLAYLQKGGAPDAFSGLPINVYASYSSQLNAYLAYLNGGGLPSSYAVLTAAQIRSYLDLLQANGQLTTVLGANATFFSQYLAFLSGGGSIDAYSGLPIATYRSYATALTAYFAYLNGGGLPSGYTALTAAQIRSYLDALSANNQLAALLGLNATFFTQYLTYLTTGGSVDAYMGLPIVTYRNYASALTLYYSYLAAGGKPSGYTVLTQTQIKSFLDTLSAAGQSAALLGANATFFSGYLTYLAGGGLPDQYASLPGMSPTVTVLSDARVFTPVATSATYKMAIARYPGSAVGTVEFANGVPTKIVSTSPGYAYTFTRDAAKTIEAGGDQFMSIGRWTNGKVTLPGETPTLTASQGVHYLVASPDVTFPTSGTIDYSIFAKTSPTSVSQAIAPGVFDGKARIAFNSTGGPLSRIELIGTILMPTSSGGTTSYAFGTQAAFDAVSSSGRTIEANKPIEVAEPFRLTSGIGSSTSPCPDGSGCSIKFYGAAAGPNAARIGFAYNTQAVSSFGLNLADSLVGAVIFGANGTFTPGTVTPTPTPPVAPTGTGLFYRAFGPLNYYGSENYLANIVAQASGKLDSFNEAQQPPQMRGTNTDHEFGTVGGVLGWSRWSGGQTSASFPYTLPENGGSGMIWGTPTANAQMPVSGTAIYNLVGSTAPVASNGSLAPGSVKSAQLGVAFQAKLVGFQATVGLGGTDYSLSTSGGVSSPSMPIIVDISSNTDNTFGGYSQLPGSSVAGGTCSGTACSLRVAGFFAGAAAAYAGVTYTFNSGTTANASAINGAIAFARADTSTPPATALAAPTGSGLTMAATGSYYYNYNPGTFNVIGFNSSVTAAADWQLQAGVWGSDKTTLLTATNVDFGTAGGIIGWSRWTGGTAQVATTKVDLPTNAGVSHIWGAPATSIPTTGIATYAMIGNTKPTVRDGSFAPGNVVSADLAVAFATGQVGFSTDILINGTTYTAASTGGVAAPSMGLAKDGSFSQLNSNNAIQGFLAGPGGAYAGVAYRTYVPAFGITGVIAFAKKP